MSTRLWLSTVQAGEHVGLHRDTVMKACESGALHGTQRTKKGHWRIHVDCLDAWAGGLACSHRMAGAA